MPSKLSDLTLELTNEGDGEPKTITVPDIGTACRALEADTGLDVECVSDGAKARVRVGTWWVCIVSHGSVRRSQMGVLTD